MCKEILEVLENALAIAGFKVMGGTTNTLEIYDSKSDRNYEVKVEEVAL